VTETSVGPLEARSNHRSPDDEVEAFIAREHHKRIDREGRDRAELEAWQESCRRHNIEHRRELAEQWCSFHHSQADRIRSSLLELVTYHEEQAKRYEPYLTEGVST